MENSFNVRWFSVLFRFLMVGVYLSVQPVSGKSTTHDYERQSWKTKMLIFPFLCRSLVIAGRVYHLTQHPWSLTIITLASNTPPLQFCLNNYPLSIAPCCRPILHEHNLWLTSLSRTTSSLCWVSESPRPDEPTDVEKLFSKPTAALGINHFKLLL